MHQDISQMAHAGNITKSSVPSKKEENKTGKQSFLQEERPSISRDEQPARALEEQAKQKETVAKQYIMT
jgi:hypothetical protein